MFELIVITIAGIIIAGVIVLSNDKKPNTSNKAPKGTMRQRVYAYIKKNRYCSQKEIAKELDTAPSNVSAHVQSLVDLGRIARPAHKGQKWIIYK